MLTEKENYMRVVRGEMPEWLPRHRVPGAGGRPATTVVLTPSILKEKRTARDEGFDVWGVEYESNRESGWMSLPKPGRFILDDITKWRDVIKAPDYSHVDWEAMAAKDLANIDRNQTAVMIQMHMGYFQSIMNFMGFDEGLCALAEDPEEVKALLDYESDFYCGFMEQVMQYYKPDLLYCWDDTATLLNTFISVPMFQDLIKPYYLKDAKAALERDIPIAMHNCGKCEDLIPDWMDFGVRIWEPAQVCNDLLKIKQDYKGKLALVGGWDSQGPAGWPNAPEDVVRDEVRKCIDTYAPDGGFVFWASVYGDPDDANVKETKGWISDEYENYGRNWYKNHG